MPKCTIAQIEREIAQLQGSGLSCAINALQAELKRRKASRNNRGRPVERQDAKAVKNRQYSAKYYSKKRGDNVGLSDIVPFEDV